MGSIASQITSLTIVYSIVYSDADQRKHQCSASLAFVRGIHRGPVNSPHKWPVTRKMFPFDDVIMIVCIMRHSAPMIDTYYRRGLFYTNHWNNYDDLSKWKHFQRCYWPFVMGIHPLPALIILWAWTNGGANNRDAGDFRHHGAHCNVNLMIKAILQR